MGVEKRLQIDHVLAFCKLLLQFTLTVSHIKKKKKVITKMQLFVNVSLGKDPGIPQWTCAPGSCSSGEMS